jgi:hypothetical protein
VPGRTYWSAVSGRQQATQSDPLVGKLDNEATDINISYLTRGIYMVSLGDKRERPVKLIKL